MAAILQATTLAVLLLGASTAPPPTDAPTAPTDAPTAPTPPLFSSTITSGITAGDTTIEVADVSGFSVGDVIVLSSGATSEEKTIVSISVTRRLSEYDRRLSAGIITVNSAFTNNFSIGATIQQLTPAYSGGDPITIYNGKKTKFWLPLGVPLKLLQTPDLVVDAVTFGGPKEFQWFDKFIMTLPDGRRVAEVSMARSANQTRSRLKGFNDLVIKVGDNPTPFRVDRKGGLTVTGMPVSIGFTNVDRTAIAATKYTPSVLIETPTISFSLFISHAGVEFPDDMYMALMYKHLDIAFLEMRDQHLYTGILPELWGIQPLSEQVEKLLHPLNKQTEKAQVCDGAPTF